MLDVLIYYWDDRDGLAFCGWWFGPKVGGDQVWAYCADQAMTPPLAQWKVPYDGPVDPTFMVGPAPPIQQPSQDQGAQAQRAYPQQSYGGPAGQQQAQGSDQSAEWRRQQAEEERQRQLQMQHQQQQQQQVEAEARRMQQQQAEMMRQHQEAQARQEEARRREEERRRQEEEAQRRRLEEERQRREEAERLRLEQERKRREEAERRQKEVERQRQEDERRRQEQAAMLSIRKVIQRVRAADDSSFAATRAELDQIVARDGTKCGANQAKIAEEVEMAVQQTTERLRLAAEQRAEQERRQREQEELVSSLLLELQKLVASAEAKVEAMKAKALPLIGNGGLPAGADAKRACAEVDEARGAAQAGVKACTDFLISNRPKVEEARTVPEETRQQLLPLQRRVHEALRELVAQWRAAEAAGRHALRRQKASRTLEKRAALFAKYDKDGDGLLSCEDVLAYAKGEFGFDVPEALASRIMTLYGGATGKGVAKESLQPVKMLIGVAREEERSRLRKARAEQRRLELEAQKVELRQKIASGASAVEATERAVEAAEATLQGLPEEVRKALSVTLVEVGRGLGPAGELHGFVAGAEAAAAAASRQLTAVRAELAAIAGQESAEDGAEELRDFLKGELRGLNGRGDVLTARLARVEQSAARLREIAGKKELADHDHVRTTVGAALRTRARKAAKSLDELFKEADSDGDGLVSEADLFKFLSSDSEAAPEELDHERLGRLVAELAEDDAKSIGVEEFRVLAKVYYRVCKQTVFTDTIGIKEGKTIRRVDEGEVFVAEEDPQEEDKAKVMRVRGRAAKDGVEGYVSIAGNQGTKFLKEGGDLFKVVQAVGLTKALSLGDAQPVRGLKEGEIVQAIKWECKEPTSGATRMKVRARADGCVGWVTLSDSEGTAYLKMV